MSLAYATKDQMKVWKSTSKPDKDYPERATDRVQLHIKKDDVNGGFIAYLGATDAYQAIRRNIETDSDAEEVKIAIPRETIEKAEKAMQPGNRAYFDDNVVTVVEVTEDDDTGIDSLRTIGKFPFVEQMDMFVDLETALQKMMSDEREEKMCVIDAKVLKKLVEQLKAGDERVYLTVTFRGAPQDLQAVVMTAFDGMETMQITAAIMPIKQ
ncbi:hypothetical protein HZA56_14135 [Candidatus Poribacteria bacterium]|nr:hypothetical protein [Candidatus Poribacteria bacterium]